MSKYTATGPFTNGAAPGISASFLNNMEQYLGYAADSNIAADGNGGLTANKFIISGSGAQVTLLAGSISRISIVKNIAVSTSKTTVAHGLGATPDIVIISVQSSSGGGSAAACYYDTSTLNSTNVDLYATGLFNVTIMCVHL